MNFANDFMGANILCNSMVKCLKIFHLIFREFKVTNNSVDIGIKSAAGLKPKMLTQQEIQPDPESKEF